MTDFRRGSLGAEFFDQMYAGTHDPWGFETRPYEARKYAATIAALPRSRYRSGFEIGCSIGVLTEMLAARCDRLLAIDIVDPPLEHARDRCAHLDHVRFARMQAPDEFPPDTFDLIVVSEVGYYWSPTDLAQASARILDHLSPGGHLLLVHWRPDVPKYPLTGDDVHRHFQDLSGRGLRHLQGQSEPLYLLDVFERA
jgi:SAM-dependent methyltransferase